MSRTRFGKILLTFSFILSLSFTNTFAQAAQEPAAPAATPAAAAPAASPLVAQGKQLFEDNCKSCHKIHDKSAGPALAHVEGRVPGGRKAIYPWVKNSTVVRKTDPYFSKLYAEWQSDMTPFPTMKDAEIDAILDYIKSEEDKVAVAAPVVGEQKGGDTKESTGGAYDNVILGLIIIVLVLVLITLTVFLNVIKKYLQDKGDKLDEDEKELVEQKFDVIGVLKSRVFIGIVAFIFICVAVCACWKGLISIGVEQNYQPTQPIPYSHKLHAGDLKINCNYCHTGVYKGKQANIPSLNICMNCHNEKGVSEGPTTGKDAIATMRKAYQNGTPIQWIRVHNLPDLAYFNHSQHTNVAGLECEQCHGPIKEMEVVKQYSPLTMGWCINCHRETNVNGKDSKYYDWMLEQHAKQKKGYKPGMKIEATEAELGGLECAKCHY